MLVITLLIITMLQAFAIYYLAVNSPFKTTPEVIPEPVPTEVSTLPLITNLPINAKWMKVLKEQLKSQRFVDKKHRNGVLTVFTLDGNVELAIDWWILRRFKGVHRYDLYTFLEDHTGLIVKGIKTHRHRSFITYNQARVHKRQRGDFRTKAGSTLKDWLDENDNHVKEEEEYLDWLSGGRFLPTTKEYLK